MADHDPPDWLMNPSLDDLQVLYDAEAAATDPREQMFNEIAHWTEARDDVFPTSDVDQEQHAGGA